MDIPTATIELTGDENEFPSTSGESDERAVDDDSKDAGDEVTDSVADLMAKSKNTKSASKKSNALTLAFRQALQAKKIPANAQGAASHRVRGAAARGVSSFAQTLAQSGSGVGVGA